MFGYVSAFLPELRVREADTYKALYCGLCHRLRADYGWMPSLGLSYDLVFLSALGYALSEEEPSAHHRVCPLKPFKKRAMIDCGFPLTYSAAMLVLLCAAKLEDDANDEQGIKAAYAGILRKMMGRQIKKAEANFSEQASMIREYYAEVERVQHIESLSLDGYAHPFGQLLANLTLGLSGEHALFDQLYAVGYQLGRWIYFMDALDDFTDDSRFGRYNVLRHVNGENLNLQMIEAVLCDASHAVYEALQKLPIVRYKGIVENIAMEGLPMQAHRVLVRIGGEQSNPS